MSAALELATAPVGWHRDALCRGRTALFYAGDELSQRIAIGVCLHCPVLAPCRTEALVEESGERFGIRAALTPSQRGATGRRTVGP